MGSLKRLRPLFVGLAVLGACVSSNPAGASSVDAGQVATYVGQVGDSNSAPDLLKAVVSDHGDGTLGFDVELAHLTELGTDGQLGVFFNTAHDDSVDNVDFVLRLDASGAEFMHWNGDAWVPLDTRPLGASFDGADFRFTLPLSDLGVKTFNFVAFSQRRNLQNLRYGFDDDQVPRGSYFANWPAVPIKDIVVPRRELHPHVPGEVGVGLDVLLADRTTAGDLDDMSCKLTYGQHVFRSPGGCDYWLPKKYRGKHLQLTISVTYRGQVAQKSFVIIPRR